MASANAGARAGWVTGLALAAALAVNVAGLGSIAVARDAALAEARGAFEGEVARRAASIERLLASIRTDLAFAVASSPVARLDDGGSSREAELRRSAAEGALLVFLRGHAEVVRVIVRSASGRALVHTGRRGGMPILWVAPSPTGLEGAAVAPGRVEPTMSLALASVGGGGALHVQSEIEPTALLGPDALLDSAGPACVLDDASGRTMARWPAGRGRAALADSVRQFTASATLMAEGWSPASPWTLRCTQSARALGLLEPVTARYRATVALNLSVMVLALLLGGFAVQQARRRERLEAAAREEVRVRELERRLFHAERLATVGRLAAGVAHEINNPLEGMTNYLVLLRDALRAGRADAAERHLAGVEQGLERTAAVVRQVLLHADPGQAALVPLDLGEVLRDSFEFMRSRRDFAAVDFRLDLAGEPLRVRGSAVMLSQVVVNLMLNACEAQPRGGEVCVSARRDGGRVWAEFADRGPGVAARDRERVFEPFFSTKDSTGLGLSICHAIARQHGGELSVEARTGGGALFRLGLPALEE